MSLVYVWRKRRQERTTQGKSELGVLETGACAREQQGGWREVAGAHSSGLWVERDQRHQGQGKIVYGLVNIHIKVTEKHL